MKKIIFILVFLLFFIIFFVGNVLADDSASGDGCGACPAGDFSAIPGTDVFQGTCANGSDSTMTVIDAGNGRSASDVGGEGGGAGEPGGGGGPAPTPEPVCIPVGEAACPQIKYKTEILPYEADTGGNRFDLAYKLCMSGRLCACPGTFFAPWSCPREVKRTQVVVIPCCAEEPTPTPPPPGDTSTPVPTAPPACNVACQRDGDCTGAKDGCTVCTNGTCQQPPTVTPGPACNVACVKDGDCTGAKDGCTVCSGGVCKPPPPACNSSCQKDGDCTGAVKDGCTVCLNNTCQKPPTPTVTPVPACNTVCSNNFACQAAKDGCTQCISNKCQVPPPPFDANACKCDGIEYGNLASGQHANITAFAKVEGTDISRAQIVGQTFRLFEGADDTHATILQTSSSIPPTIVSRDANKVRYKSIWSLNVPQLKDGYTYRIQAQISCQPKNVLGTTTCNPSIFASLWSLLTGAPACPLAQPSVQTAPNLSSAQGLGTGSSSPSASRDTLQLKTFTPVTLLQKTCTFIKFRVGQ